MQESTKSIVRIDDLDRALVDRLRLDGRENSRSLADALGVNEATVAARLRRLEEASIVRVVALTDMQIYGHRELVFVSIRIAGRTAFDVGADLAKIPETMAVTVLTGRFDLMVALLARNQTHLATLLGTTLRKIRGVEDIHAQLVLKVFKYESKWALLSSDPGTTPDAEPGESVDELDISIIRLLQEDARRSNRWVAANLHVSEGTIRTRIKRMQDDGVIRIQALSDVAAFGVSAHAWIGIHCSAVSVETVAKRLANEKNIAVLAQTLGSFDLIAVVNAGDRSELMDSILNRIATIPGVRRTETMESCATLKHAYTWARLI